LQRQQEQKKPSIFTITNKVKYTILDFVIAGIWLINGLFCKVMNGVPRHREIVVYIFGKTHAVKFTILIGIAEILMAIWILSHIKTKMNAWLQIGIIGTMNLLEFIFVPHLLLWGRFNIIFAILLILAIYYNEFILKKKQKA
jgi:hypothetical protein